MAGSKLTAAQKAFLAQHSDSDLYIVGGTAAVPASVEADLGNFAGRIAGADRYLTSVEMAKEFFNAPEKVVLAYAWDFPDGLLAGPLGYALDAPILLVDGTHYAAAQNYCKTNGITGGYIVGADNLVTDKAAVAVFSLKSADQIVLK